MAWVRIDDQVPRHEKFLAAGPAACWLWVCGVAHAQSQLTDGFVSDIALPTIGVLKGYKPLAEALVRVGLWERVERGYQVHDYLEHNASRVEVLERRREDAERKKNGGRKDSARNPNRDGHSGESGNGSDSTVPRARVPTRPDPTVLPKEPEAHTPREGFDSDGRSAAVPLHRQMGDHRNHAKCFIGDRDCGVCVPASLHHEFTGKVGPLGNGDPDTYVRGFYQRVNEQWAGQTIGDDAFVFWRARFQEAHGTTKTTPTPRQGSADGMVRMLTRASEAVINRDDQ